MGTMRASLDRTAFSKRLRLREVFGTGFLFALMALLCHCVFLPQFFGLPSEMFTFVGGDSTTQLIPAVMMLEQNLLEGNLFWSWDYGLGGDLFEQFSYYYTTSPFFYAMFFLKLALGQAGGSYYATQVWFVVGSILKQMLCMALMFGLLRQEGRAPLFSCMGALLYGCSIWYIDNSLAFNFMTDAMIWPPAIALAFGRLRRTGSWFPLVIVVSLCVANSFYFGYINCIFCFVFAVVFCFPGKAEGASRGEAYLRFAKRLGFLSLVLLGALALSAVAFLPSLDALFSSDRMPVSIEFEPFPTVDLILILPELLFAKGAWFSWVNLQTFAFPIALLLVFCIAWRSAGGQVRRKTVFLLIMFVLWLVPCCSSLMNGLSYPTNRWCYLFVFAAAYLFPDIVETALAQKRISLKFLFAVFAFVALVCLTYGARTADAYETTGYRLGGLFGSDYLLYALGLLFLVVLALRQKGVDRGSLALRSNASNAVLLGLFVASLCLAMPFGPYALLSGFRDSSNTLVFSGEEDFNALYEGDEATRAAYAQVKNESAGSFSRFIDDEATQNMSNRDCEARYENRSWALGGHSASLYNSLLSRSLNQWLKYDYGVTSTTLSTNQYRGLGHRLLLENAWGVRYKFNNGPNANLHGYTELPSEAGALVYENGYPVGIDLWYDVWTDEDTWKSWSFAQKDAKILTTAAISDKSASSSQTVSRMEKDDGSHPGVTRCESGDYTYVLSRCTVEREGNRVFLSAEEGAEATLSLPYQDGAGEWHIGFDLCDSEGGFNLWVNGENYWTNPESPWAYPQSRYSICVPSSALQGDVVIAFDAGSYEIADFSLEYLSYDLLEEWTEKANRSYLEDASVEANRISGTIDADDGGILALSLPYSSDWACFVDGDEAETLLVNGQFTGVALEQGEHEVLFVYRNKTVLIGLFISLLSLGVLLALFFVQKKRASRFRSCLVDLFG